MSKSKKREVGRYTIVQLVETKTRRFYSKNEIDILSNEIQKYNDNAKNPFLIGDFYVNYPKGIISFNVYKKIINNSTLKEIDSWTSKLDNEEEIKKKYQTDKSNDNPFLIVYRINKRIRKLPIFYKGSSSYLNFHYISGCFSSYSNRVDFINLILDNQQIRASVRHSFNAYDNLRALREKLAFNIQTDNSSNTMLNFYYEFCYEGGGFNYFNFRLLAVLLKKYIDSIKLLEPIEQNKDEEPEECQSEEIPGQIMLEEFAWHYLREDYEEAKLSGDHKKIMVPRHETTK